MNDSDILADSTLTLIEEDVGKKFYTYDELKKILIHMKDSTVYDCIIAILGHWRQGKSPQES